MAIIRVNDIGNFKNIDLIRTATALQDLNLSISLIKNESYLF